MTLHLTSAFGSVLGHAGSPAALAVRSATAATTSWLAVAVNPNNTLPGTAQLTQLLGGLMTWVLLACVAAVLAGAAAWGFGAKFGNYGSAQSGRMMVFGGAVGAMVAGAAVAMVNFAFHLGGTVS